MEAMEAEIGLYFAALFAIFALEGISAYSPMTHEMLVQSHHHMRECVKHDARAAALAEAPSAPAEASAALPRDFDLEGGRRDGSARRSRKGISVPFCQAVSKAALASASTSLDLVNRFSSKFPSLAPVKFALPPM